MKIILLGPQGAGKGTVASGIKDIFGIVHISTGDLFRENIKNKTELGKQVEEIINSGKLVPDDLTVKMLKSRIDMPDCKNGFILDGFPRNLNQAKKLDEVETIDKVILLTIPKEVSIKRLSSRRQCKNCGMIFNIISKPPKKENICDSCGGELYQRDDDKEEAIRERLSIYEKETAPLIEYYKDKLVEIDGSENIDTVIEKVKAVISR